MIESGWFFYIYMFYLDIVDYTSRSIVKVARDWLKVTFDGKEDLWIAIEDAVFITDKNSNPMQEFGKNKQEIFSESLLLLILIRKVAFLWYFKIVNKNKIVFCVLTIFITYFESSKLLIELTEFILKIEKVRSFLIKVKVLRDFFLILS